MLRRFDKAKGQWQFQDAKANFADVFRFARERGPQRVTRHGKGTVVVVAAEQFDAIATARRAQRLFAGCGINLDAAPDVGRHVCFSDATALPD